MEVTTVVFANSSEEYLVPQQTAQHVKDPATLGVVVPVQEIEQAPLRVDDRLAGDVRFQVALAAPLHSLAEVLDALDLLEE